MNTEELILNLAKWLQKNTDFACNLEWDEFDEDAKLNFKGKAQNLIASVLVPAGLGWMQEVENEVVLDKFPRGGKVRETAKEMVFVPLTKQGVTKK